MKMTIIHGVSALLLLSLFIISCASDEDFTDNDTPSNPTTPGEGDDIIDNVLDLPDTPFNYVNINLPNHYNAPPINNSDNTPGNNPITDLGATLGRVLFYDVNLSANNTISCSSCHVQQAGFSDPDRFSTGFEGGLTGRNSMGLANAKYYQNGRFFWDERSATLEEQVLQPIQDHIEMGMELDDLVAKLQVLDYYPILFDNAFGTPDVTSDRISRALAQFIRSMVSFDSKFDAGVAAVGGNFNDNTQFPNFTAEENQGFQIYFTNRGNCDACHGTAATISPEARNNGLFLDYPDNGLGNVTGNPNDNGKFKSPSLRNIELTAPYMHDGSLASLEDVVAHYNNGVQNHPNLDNRLRGNGGQPRRLNLSQQEQAALVAFLRTLTDNSFITDEKFSNPFIGD